MSARIEFFPVGNGDMTLVTLESGRTILIDCDIRGAADDEGDDDTPNVGKYLRSRIERDDDDRLFVDVFLLSHPDQDHCSGLKNHFHLGPVGKWKEKDDKIIIREMWSSPIVFRRRDSSGSLCDDAVAWRDEARRRVNLYKNTATFEYGDRILILGEDIDHKTDGIEEIVIELGEVIQEIGGEVDGTFVGHLLAPLKMSADEEDDEEALLAKNRSSVITKFVISADGNHDACRFLSGGDAEVAIWERLWKKYGKSDRLTYHVMQTPHHCSWHSLSYESWSEKGKGAQVSTEARSALSQAQPSAIIVASCKAISDDDNDPPCMGAADQYRDIAAKVSGEFVCVAEYVGESGDETLCIDIGSKGFSVNSGGGTNTSASVGVGGGLRKTDKRGGGRYAQSGG